jgi:hypothetical protein
VVSRRHDSSSARELGRRSNALRCHMPWTASSGAGPRRQRHARILSNFMTASLGACRGLWAP